MTSDDIRSRAEIARNVAHEADLRAGFLLLLSHHAAQIEELLDDAPESLFVRFDIQVEDAEARSERGDAQARLLPWARPGFAGCKIADASEAGGPGSGRDGLDESASGADGDGAGSDHAVLEGKAGRAHPKPEVSDLPKALREDPAAANQGDSGSQPDETVARIIETEVSADRHDPEAQAPASVGDGSAVALLPYVDDTYTVLLDWADADGIVKRKAGEVAATIGEPVGRVARAIRTLRENGLLQKSLRDGVDVYEVTRTPFDFGASLPPEDSRGQDVGNAETTVENESDEVRVNPQTATSELVHCEPNQKPGNTGSELALDQNDEEAVKTGPVAGATAPTAYVPRAQNLRDFSQAAISVADQLLPKIKTAVANGSPRPLFGLGHLTKSLKVSEPLLLKAFHCLEVRGDIRRLNSFPGHETVELINSRTEANEAAE